MLAVALVYAGMLAGAVALLALIRPLRRLRLHPRRRGGMLLLASVSLVAVGMTLPAPDVRVTQRTTRLDQYMPVYQFHEFHATRVASSPAVVYDAIQRVTAGEIRFFQLLTAVRRLGRSGPESILAAPERVPIIHVATRTTFVTLAKDTGREILIGTVVLAPPRATDARPRTAQEFQSLMKPGYALAAMNFRITPLDSMNTYLTTETRIFATDAATRRRFARYWRVIYPGSAIIRRSWLRAVRRRAERPAPS